MREALTRVTRAGKRREGERELGWREREGGGREIGRERVREKNRQTDRRINTE